MLMPPPLPRDLRGRPFSVAEARAEGVPRSRLRARDLESPHHGARTPTPAATVRERCLAFVPVMAEHQFFSHHTAALLWEMPLPSWCVDGPLHVSSPHALREPRRPGIVGHRVQLSDPSRLHDLGGLRLCSSAETWAQLGSVLGVDDLVAAGDFVIGRGALATRLELEEAVERLRRRGAVDLRVALGLLHPAAESPQESRLRVAIHHACLPAPEVNWTLRSSRGRFVARLDLAYPRYRVACEYDGRQHAEDPEQFARDADRWHDIAEQGWTLVRVLSPHLADGSAVRRLRTALVRAGWSPAHT